MYLSGYYRLSRFNDGPFLRDVPRIVDSLEFDLSNSLLQNSKDAFFLANGAYVDRDYMELASYRTSRFESALKDHFERFLTLQIDLLNCFDDLFVTSSIPGMLAEYAIVGATSKSSFPDDFMNSEFNMSRFPFVYFKRQIGKRSFQLCAMENV